jgi:two-component system sensor histidine kinase KdpD
MKGESVQMKNAESSINNQVTRTSSQKPFSGIIVQIWNSNPTKYFLSALIISVVGLIFYYLQIHISYQAVSLVFLFVISLLPLLNFKPGPIFLAAIMSAFIWNYFFIPPAFTLRIGKIEDVLMYVMYFVIAIVSGFLISRIRMQQLTINQKEKKTAALYNLTRDLSAAKSLDDVTEFSIKQLKDTFHTEVLFIYAESDKYLSKNSHRFSTITIDDGEWSIAQLVFLNSEKVGRFTQAIPSISQITYLPIYTKDRKLGVVGLLFPENSSFDPETDYLLNTFMTQIGVAVEREYLKELAKQNLLLAETEKLYKTLFDSVSHELKTPITTILGAVSSLKDDKIIINKPIFYRLINEANIAAERLKRLVENLLDITRLESGTLKLKKEWHSISDLINSAIHRIRIEDAEHKIKCQISENTGLYNFDYPLLEQALVNIIHNSIEYTPSNCEIEINAERKKDQIVIIISDNGTGFPEGELKNIFKKFYRIPGTKAGGTGLGLSIAKGFIEAHGGSIIAKNNETGGAKFIISLPSE